MIQTSDIYCILMIQISFKITRMKFLFLLTTLAMTLTWNGVAQVKNPVI